MKRTSFISILATGAGLAFASALLISLASCNKEKNQPEPEPQPESVITMVTEKAVDEAIVLVFDQNDKPVVEGATETKSVKTEEGWFGKEYKLTSKTITIKGKVTRFFCAYNSLKSLSLRKNTELTYLRCCNNSLKSLDVNKNRLLTFLDCSSNSLESLDVSVNTALVKLDCSHNSLESLDVGVNTALVKLDCSYNSLESLDVSGNTALVDLNCCVNPLKSLDVSQNTKLTELYCYGNYLTRKSVKLPTLASKGVLYFKNEMAGDLQMLTPEEVKQVEQSWEVKKYNGGAWVPYKGEERVIIMKLDCAVGDTISLDFDYNGEYPVVEGATVADFSWEYKLTSEKKTITIKGNVTMLKCWHVPIATLDLRKSTELKTLNLCDNALKDLDVSRNTELTFLNCQNNRLTSLDVSNNTKLTSLTCEYNNNLKTLDVSSNTKLTSLDCNKCGLSSLDVSNNTELEYVQCLQNQLYFESLKLPDLKGKKTGFLCFKNTPAGDTQMLTPEQVTQIKGKNWRVQQVNNDSSGWIDYPGE